MSFYFPLSQIEPKGKKIYDCSSCKLKDTKIHSPEIQPLIGKEYDGIVILGQSPSKTDDKKGIPFEDDKADIIRESAVKQGIKLSKEGAFLFAVSCLYKKESETYFKCCQEKMHKHLKDLQPKIIICCGDMAFKSLFRLKEKISITKLRGRVIPNFEHNCVVFPVYDIYDLKMYRMRDEEESFNNYYSHTIKWDLEKAFSLYKEVFYDTNKLDEFLNSRKILKDIKIKEVKEVFQLNTLKKEILKEKKFSFDYETTNTKPYNNFFEIVYIGFGIKNKAWVIHEDFWKDSPKKEKTLKKFLIDLLTDEKILKIIQNSMFEDLCSRFFLGIEKINNVFCTMLATHVIDERSGCTSQDFQNLVRFGIPPYSETIKRFIESDKNDKVNRIREADKKEMIKYNALDVITCWYNWEFLENHALNSYDKARECNSFLLDGHEIFANMSQRGIHIGKKEYDEFSDLIETSLSQIEEQIINLPEVKEFCLIMEERNNKPEKLLKELNNKK